jgi:16S rRNA (guanine527-N7)-methyltransferase
VRRKFDAVCARAVAPLPKLLPWAIPLLKPGGLAILWKGPAVMEELPEAAEQARRLGATLLEPARYDVPGREWERLLVVVEKGR